jgi:hypothetical protein
MSPATKKPTQKTLRNTMANRACAGGKSTTGAAGEGGGYIPLPLINRIYIIASVFPVSAAWQKAASAAAVRAAAAL